MIKIYQDLLLKNELKFKVKGIERSREIRKVNKETRKRQHKK